MGMAYYNTKIGIRHPSLKYDLFGAFVEACQKRNIAVTAYVNVGLSHEEGLLHRDWLVLNADGQTYLPNRMGNFMRMMCPNTGYGDHVVAMCREIVENYPVAGLFLDCMHQHPCVGVECIREMKQRGIDWEDPRQLREFANLSRVRIAQRIADAAKSVRPDLLLYFNGVSYEYQEEIGTYLEYECLPTGGWGYEALPLYGRFLRTLGKPLLNMTGRFHRSWGDFGGIRTEASLEYDCLYGLALGMRTTIGDHFHPRGDLNTAVFDLIERVYGRLQKLEPWIDGAKGAAEIAVVAPEPGFCYVHPEEFSQSQAALKGCARMLCELKQQFDVVSMARSWEGYRLLILPDLILLDPAAADKVRKHLAQGGAILSTGWSGADPEKKAFVLKEWGVKLEGEDPFDPAFLLVGEALSEGMPDMPITLYDRGTAIAATGDDKANLVVSLLAKTEFAVNRVVARVNDPNNEWLFTSAWGVDVAVSPPRLLAALVDSDEEPELGHSGEVVSLASLGGADLLESVLTEESPFTGRSAAELSAALPEGVVLVALVRAGQARAPLPETVLAAGDVVVLLSSARSDDALLAVLSGSDRAAD